MDYKKYTAVIAILFAAIAVIAVVRITNYYAPTGLQASAQTNLTVNNSCDLQLNVTDYPGLFYGVINPNATFNGNNITVNYSNQGNFEQNVSINATRFYVNDSGTEPSTSALNCNQTRYANNSSTTGLTPPNWDLLLNSTGICQGRGIATETETGTLNRIMPNQSYPGSGGATPNHANNNTTFKINIPQGTPPGRYTQNVTFLAAC